MDAGKPHGGRRHLLCSVPDEMNNFLVCHKLLGVWTVAATACIPVSNNTTHYSLDSVITPRSPRTHSPCTSSICDPLWEGLYIIYLSVFSPASFISRWTQDVPRNRTDLALLHVEGLNVLVVPGFFPKTPRRIPRCSLNRGLIKMVWTL